MNVYRITYYIGTDTPENTKTMEIIERTEERAHNLFQSHCAGTITGTELIRTDVSATKEQELEALAWIREVVTELGPQSYVAKAFDGCFEDAEENIANDFACSWKDRAESAEEKLADAIVAQKEAETEATRLSDRVTELEEALMAATAKTVPTALLKHAYLIIDNRLTEARGRMAELADQMMVYAQTPTSAAFQETVEEYSRLKARRIGCEEALTGLQEFLSESEEGGAV